MFTGIIEAVGTVQAVRKAGASSALTLERPKGFDDLKLGDSVAVDGVCLTVSRLDAGSFTADVMHETLERSSLGALRRGSRVNLERALLATGRFGGHIVSGHIDGRGIITRIEQDDNARWYTVEADASILRYVVVKGSVALDGISLTVAKLGPRSLSVSIIPHTAKETTLSSKRVGDTVNIENDVIGKYVERLLTFSEATDKQLAGTTAADTAATTAGIATDKAGSTAGSTGRITAEFLTQNGF
ncbi:MAG: riboflavin synthase [Coriobacteriales bacterium]|jgi:riboflavin synthase|nr:riboflavin synthase [Coriobacteriales bacterium]